MTKSRLREVLRGIILNLRLILDQYQVYVLLETIFSEKRQISTRKTDSLAHGSVISSYDLPIKHDLPRWKEEI